MSNENAVEIKTETAAAQSEAVETSSNSTEVDYEAELAKANAKIAKIGEEKENYRKGMLKAKGKIPDEDDNSSNDEDMDSKVKRLVKEELLKTQEAVAIAEKDNLVVNLAKKNKELALALKNRGQVTSPSAAGSNSDKPEVKNDKILSVDQINSLKAKGWDDKKIEEFKKNLARPSMPK